MKKYLLFLVLALAAPVQAGIAPSQVDPSLAIVSQSLGFRVLVYSICSPEHCWSETHLQNVSFGTEDPKIICSTKINEIANGHAISNVNWAFVENAPVASLSAKASHGGFEPRIITIKPDRECKYEIQGASTTGF